MVSDKDFDAIDKKSSKFKDESNANNKNMFSDFELPITEQDWLETKFKLDSEKSNIQNEVPELSQLADLEIQPEPSDWPETYKKYKSEKRRRFFFYWLNRAGIFIGILLIGFLLWFNTPDNQKNNPLNESSQGNLEPVETTQSSPSLQVTTPLSDNNIAHSESKIDLKTEHPSDVEPSASTQTPRSNSINIKPSSQTPSNTNIPPALKQENNVAQNTENLNVVKDENNVIASQEENTADNETEIANNASQTTALTLLELTEKLNNNFLNMLLFHLRNHQEDFNFIELKRAAPFQPIINKKSYSLRFALVNKIDYSYRRLNNDNPEKYNNIRNQSDQAQYRYSAGFEVALPIKKMMYTAGLNYTTYNFKSKYDYNYRVFDSIPVYDQTGTVIIGHFLTRGRDTAINETQNIKVSQLQMPLSVSYQIFNQKKLSIFAGLGTVLSMNTKQSGVKMINPNNNQLYYYQRLGNIERKFNVAPMLMADVHYRLKNNWSVSAGISGSMNLKSRFNNSFGAKEYLYSYGLQFKIIKDLTWYKQ